jgi:hypothetical protein
LGWPPAPHLVTTSCVALSTCASTGASDPLHVVCDSSKRKSTGSDHRLTYKRYYKLVCVLKRSNLGWTPATHSDTTSCVALSTCASTGVSDQLYVVRDSSKRKSTGSDHRLTYKRYYDLVCVLKRSNWQLELAASNRF